jgi:sulfur carrier protein ThiS
MNKTDKVNIFLQNAFDFFMRSSKEIDEGVRLNDQLKICDAAEKLWNAIINATNALILKELDVVPASQWERRKLLEKLEDLLPEVGRLDLRDRYGARELYLYEMTVYDGIIDPEMLRREVDRVKKYLDDVKKLIET